MSSFIPANAGGAGNVTVETDGWYPVLSVVECREQTSIGSAFDAERIGAELRVAAIEVAASIADWRRRQTASTLAAIPAPQWDGVSEKVLLYRRAVYALCRARLVDVTRDTSTTWDGHQRAIALEGTAAAWRQMAQEALCRLADRPRTVVELI